MSAFLNTKNITFSKLPIIFFILLWLFFYQPKYITTFDTNVEIKKRLFLITMTLSRSKVSAGFDGACCFLGESLVKWSSFTDHVCEWDNPAKGLFGGDFI